MPSDCDCYGNCHCHSNGDSDSNRNSYRNCNRDTNSNFYFYADPNTTAQPNTYTDCNGNAYAHCYASCKPDTYAEAYSHTEDCTDAEIASDAGTAPGFDTIKTVLEDLVTRELARQTREFSPKVDWLLRRRCQNSRRRRKISAAKPRSFYRRVEDNAFHLRAQPKNLSLFA